MTIDVVFDPPTPLDGKDTFKAKAQAVFALLNAWSGQANTLAGQANAAVGAAQQGASDADAAKDLAQQSQGLAEQAVLDAAHQVDLATQQAGLAAAAAAGIAETWQPDAIYARNKLVWLDASTGALYRCIQTHSGRGQTPDTDPDYWSLVDAGATLSAKLQGLSTADRSPLAASDTALQALGKLQAQVEDVLGAAPLTGFTLADGSPVTETDTAVQAFGKLQRQLVGVRTPNNISPADGATDTIWAAPLLVGTDYRSIYGSPMAALQVQVSTLADFSAPLHDSGTVAATASSYRVPTGVVAASTAYYWRMRHKSVDGDWSAWSEPTSFTTGASLGHYIDVLPAPTPANFGDPFEGGFYAGMIWVQGAQSASSLTIGTGSKTFAVPDQLAAPIGYLGQQVEVRSRANPANKFVGTVLGALGTSLTIDVTSVGGSGTFADWSIMQRHRVIVAPKASGENPGVAIKSGATALPVACQTLNDGLAATQAMRDADSAIVYPAAHWARGLNIGGKTDWYIPARDELELCWRNLKPVTDNNYTTARSNSSINYARDGAYNDATTGMGANLNSTPQGAAYTTAVPAQTAAAAFQAGGVEAFEFGSAYYWSSTEYDATYAWFQYWHSSYPGRQGNVNKTNAYRVRAARRSVI